MPVLLRMVPLLILAAAATAVEVVVVAGAKADVRRFPMVVTDLAAAVGVVVETDSVTVLRYCGRGACYTASGRLMDDELPDDVEDTELWEFHMDVSGSPVAPRKIPQTLVDAQVLLAFPTLSMLTLRAIYVIGVPPAGDGTLPGLIIISAIVLAQIVGWLLYCKEKYFERDAQTDTEMHECSEKPLEDDCSL